MDKNLHNLDDIFTKGYQQYEEQPSATTWDKLTARLDKEDADKYKKRLISWKLTSMLLLFLLSGFAVYEYFITSKNTGVIGFSKKENSKDPVAPKLKKPSAGAVFDNTREQQKADQPTNNTVPERSIVKQDAINALPETGLKDNTITDNKANPVLPAFNKKTDHKYNQQKPVLQHKKSDLKKRKPGADNEKSKFKNTDVNNAALLTQLNRNEAKQQRKLIATAVERIINPDSSSLNIILPKKLNLLISDSSISTSTITAANKKNARHFKPYWSLTAFASNDWGWYRLDNGIQDGNIQDEKEEINKREKHEPSFSAGILAARQLTEHLGIKTGLIYSNTAIIIDPQQMYASRQPNGIIAYKYITSSGYGYVNPGNGSSPAVGDSLQSATAQHNLQSISIPLLLTYKFDKKKFSIIPSAGITANFITRATVQTTVIDALNREAVTINGLSGMRNFYAGLRADVNLQYNYNNRWSLNLLPTFNYALTPITKSNVVKTYPYSFGIGAGITCKF